MKVRWYWLTSQLGVPVTYHLQRDWRVRWRGIYGVQIGLTFIGLVRSFDAD